MEEYAKSLEKILEFRKAKAQYPLNDAKLKIYGKYVGKIQ